MYPSYVLPLGLGPKTLTGFGYLSFLRGGGLFPRKELEPPPRKELEPPRRLGRRLLRNWNQTGTSQEKPYGSRQNRSWDDSDKCSWGWELWSS